MVVKKEVGKYQVNILSGYVGGKHTGLVNFYEPSGAFIGYAEFIKNGEPLPPNRQRPDGEINIYYNETALGPMLDTLRNEKPVYVQFNTVPGWEWGSVGTGGEPVGEQEAPAPL
jgi:hypothetical protein